MIETKMIETNEGGAPPRFIGDSVAEGIPSSLPKLSRNKPKCFKLLAVAVTLQVGALLAFAMPYAQTLAEGPCLTLKGYTYDPRDPLKGDFVAINFDVGKKANLKSFKPGETAYLTFEKGKPYWQAVKADKEMPKTVGAGEVAMKVIVNRGEATPPSVTLGIEKYYVSEGAGRNLNIDRSNELAAEIAVGKNGQPVFKHLLVDGKIFGR